MVSQFAIRIRLFLAFAITAMLAQDASAATGDQILPASTKGYVSIPNWDTFHEKFNATKLGELAADPVMKPFVDDISEQINERLGQTGARFGIDWDQLANVCSGEICIGSIEPKAGKQKQAFAAIVDVEGKAAEVVTLMASVDKRLKKRKATVEIKTVGNTEVRIYSIPVKRGARKRFDAVLYSHAGKLVAVDHVEIAMQLMKNCSKPAANNLSTLPAFQETMTRSEAAGNESPLVRFFIEPLGYARLARESVGTARKRRQAADVISAIQNQGFGAIKGVGGNLQLATNKYELVANAFAYAPAKAEGGFKLASRILNTLGEADPAAPNWVPENVNGYHVTSCDIGEAYKYIDTLVDEVSGEPGFFGDLIKNIETDPQGPQIRVKQDLIDHLGKRIIMISDCVVPVTPESERVLVAIKLNNAEQMAKTIRKIMIQDPNARKREVDGKVIWEIIGEDDEAIPTVVIGGDDLASLGGFDDDDEEEGPGFLEEMTNAAVSVVDGYLMVTNQVDFIVEVIKQDSPQDLEQTAEFQLVRTALNELGAGKDSLRSFVRVDEVVRASYELVRSGRMPESKGILGIILNKALASDQKGVARRQRINGKNLPDFQVVRRYLGPGGGYLRSENDGWSLVVVGLSKDAQAAKPGVADAADVGVLETASKREESNK